MADPAVGESALVSAPRRRVLFVLVNGGGNVVAQLSVARRLVARGHDVHVLGDRAVAAAVEAVGARWHGFRHAPDGMPAGDTLEAREWERGTPIAKLRRVGQRLMFGPAALHARDVLETAERLRPDALAVDCLLFGAMAAAEQLEIPAAVLVHFPMYGAIEGVTPFGLGLTPATSATGRARDALLNALTRRLFAFGLGPLNAARRELGLEPLTNVFGQLYRLDRALMFLPREFDFVPRGLPTNVSYVGPQLDDPLLPNTPPTALPASPHDDDRPLVLLTLGSTYQQQEGLFSRALAALGTLPVRSVAMHGVLPPPSTGVAPNVHVVRWAPHATLLPRASAVVCHGGLGTVMKALAYGVPVVVLPLGRDQLDNAARVAACGAGIRLAPGAGTTDIANAVQRVLNDPRFRAGASRLQRVIARDVAADRAVVELEALAAGGHGAADGA